MKNNNSKYNILSPALIKILSKLPDFILERATSSAGDEDMWYCKEGLRTIEYLRYRDVMAYLFTPYEEREAFYAKHHQNIKPGKFLIKCKEYTYEKAHALAAELEPPEVIVAKGEMIKWLYREYFHASQDTGTLASSCMRHKNMSDWFQLYADNARMVMIMDEGRILARAILWDEVTNGEETLTFLDRIYGTEKSVIQLKNYAEEKGYFSKVNQSYTKHKVSLAGRVLDLENFYINLKNPIDYKKNLPYLDSFEYGEFKDEKLSVIRNRPKGYTSHNIRFVDGGLGEKICRYCGGPVSKVYGCCIHCSKHHSSTGRSGVECPICKEMYTAYSYKQPHLACLLKLKYKCKDCNEIHIANSQAEFEAKTCKEDEWIIDGGTETSTKHEIESDES